MSSFRTGRSCGCLALVFTLSAASADADVKSLADRVPPGANAIAVIQVESLLNSKVGKAEGWRQKLTDAYAAGPLIVPPDARQVVMASWIEPANLDPVWEVSLIQVSKDISVDRIARDERGFTEELRGRHAAWAPSNAYYLRLENNLLGVVCPADRQFAARWSGTVGGADSLSPYLRAAVKDLSGSTAYLFAMDLGDVVSAKRVRRRLVLEDFACLAGMKLDEHAVSSAVASVRGLRLTVAVDESIAGQCVIEFADSVAPLASFAKPLLMEILEQSGASIADLADWTVKAEGTSILAGGKLTTEGLRQLCSIINPPSPAQVDDTPGHAGRTMDSRGAAPAAAAAAAPAADAAAVASQRYFQSVAKIVDGFGKRVRTSSSLTKGATYLARDARNISRLPILNVDPELLAWGGDVSARLLNVAAVAGVGGLQAQARTAAVKDTYSTGSTYSEGSYGDVMVNPNDAVDARNAARERRAAAAEERAKALQQAAQTIQEIEASRAAIRAAMTAKYKIEF